MSGFMVLWIQSRSQRRSVVLDMNGVYKKVLGNPKDRSSS